MQQLIPNKLLLVAFFMVGLATSLNADKHEMTIELPMSAGLESFREPLGKWHAVGTASMDPVRQQRITTEPGEGVIFNQGRTSNLLTKMEHGDVELHIEFMVPQKSNSGVYFQGRYEIQVFDSWGVEEPQHSDCGGIYQRWVDGKGFDGHPPRSNASRKPGEWQTLDVVFRAPRFDAEGNKSANARFVSVIHNGIVVHENVELTGPTRSATFNDEKPLGPLMLQGDHGPVVYRNIRLKPLGRSGK